MAIFGKHKWWIVTALLTAPLIALAAGVPNVFAPNTPISSALVNANFTNLADRVTVLEGGNLAARLTALEAANARSSALLVMNNLVGALPATGLTRTFAASGNSPLLIIVSATAFTTTAGSLLDIAVELDGLVIGNLRAAATEVSSHKTLPMRAIPVAMPAMGNHNLTLSHGNATTTSDGADRFNVTVVELH